jgi:hypothetical protein
MRIHNTVRLFAVLLLLSLPGSLFAQAGYVAGMEMVNRAGQKLADNIQQMQQELQQSRSLEKFRKHFEAFQGQLKVYNQRINEAYRAADEEVQRIIRQHDEKDVSKWDPRDQEALKQAKARRDLCITHMMTLRELRQEATEINGMSAMRNAQVFAKSYQWFQDRLGKMAVKLQDFGSSSGLAPGDGSGRPGGGSSGQSGGLRGVTPLLKIRNDSKDLWFLIGSTWLKPGQEMQLSASKLTVRVLAMTKTRDFIMNKKPTRNATIYEQSPYRFRFTVDVQGTSGETLWEVVEEKYEWNVLQPPKYQMPHSFTTHKKTNDVLIWTPPTLRNSVRDSAQTFTFNPRAELRWQYTRTGDMGNVKKTEFEFAHGTLSVFVYPQ